jgi:hypothetical protein
VSPVDVRAAVRYDLHYHLAKTEEAEHGLNLMKRVKNG